MAALEEQQMFFHLVHCPGEGANKKHLALSRISSHPCHAILIALRFPWFTPPYHFWLWSFSVKGCMYPLKPLWLTSTTMARWIWQCAGSEPRPQRSHMSPFAHFHPCRCQKAIPGLICWRMRDIDQGRVALATAAEAVLGRPSASWSLTRWTSPDRTSRAVLLIPSKLPTERRLICCHRHWSFVVVCCMLSHSFMSDSLRPHGL